MHLEEIDQKEQYNQHTDHSNVTFTLRGLPTETTNEHLASLLIVIILASEIVKMIAHISFLEMSMPKLS